MEERERLLSALARDQHGVFTMKQAIACGLPRSTTTARAARGVYETIHPGVFGIAGSDDSWRRRVIAAVLSTPTPCAASHRTAAYLWGMMSLRPDIPEVVTPRHRRLERADFVVHESKDLIASDVVVLDGVPVTSADRTIVDLGASAPSWLVERCLDSGLRKELFTAWQVRCFLARVARPGRTGVGIIRPLILERLEWESLTDSDLEDLLRTVIKRSPHPMPEPQFKVFEPLGDFVGRFDFAYPQRMALLEGDSLRYHRDPVSFERDREKQNRVHALGWTVYRFTWRQLIDDPESVLAIIDAIWTD